MRLFIATVTLWALASAKPEMYKEKEDFQFSRSSSDDGSKSGYYGAQRGNMGGNYERAHNMDSLAQHQMSTLVRQVDGELGEGANTRTGSVFTAGNSRGIYGSGNYDLSNLKGRNFGESASYDDQYSSSLLSQDSRNHAHLYSGINNAQYSGSQLDASDLSSGYQYGGLGSQYTQAQDNQAESQYHGSSRNFQYGGQGASQYKYYSHGSSQARNDFDQSANLQSNNNYNVNTKSRLISTIPHRIYLRPGTRVTIPVAAETYDASHSSLSQQQSAVNTDAEILNSGRNYVIKPVGTPKHYESSYSYRKEWEKHDTQPIPIIPTENPFPKNSELYEDSQISGASGQQSHGEVDSTNVLSSNLNSAQLSSLDSAQLSSLNSAQLSSVNSAQLNSLNSAHSNSAHSSSLNSAYSSGYSGNTKSAASNRLQYLSQMHNTAGLASSSGVHQANTQNLGESNLYNNLNLIDGNSQPKNYQSSYSYHKSWERRGDPYIIKPAGSDIGSQVSQKLVADSASYGTHSHSQYGSHYSQSQDDCVEPVRHKRSYNTHQFQQNQNQHFEHGQQADNKWENLENLGQQTQKDWLFIPKFDQHYHNQDQFGQETQNSWGDLESFGQHQNQMGQLEDLGQQTQNMWGNLESFGQDKYQVGQLEDLGQQTQNSWGDLESFGQHQNQMRPSEDLGQQTQKLWGNLESFGQDKNLVGQFENLGQQTQHSWGDLETFGQHQNKIEKLEDFGQDHPSVQDHSENLDHQLRKPSGNLEDLSQQSQNTWGHFDDLGQQTQNLEDLGQETQKQIGKLEDLGQESQSTLDHSDNLNQQFQIENGKLEDFGQQTQNKEDNIENLVHQPQTQVDVGQQTQGMWDHIDSLNQQGHNQVTKLDDLGQQTQNTWDLDNFHTQSQSQIEQLSNFGQETQSVWDHNNNFRHQDQSQVGKLEDLGQQTQNSFGLENFNQQSLSQTEQLSNFGQETQNIWDHIDKFTHPEQSQVEQIENVGQQTQPLEVGDLGQETQNTWDNLESLGKQTHPNWKDVENQKTQGHSQETEQFVPQTESKSFDQQSFNQQTQNGWSQVEDVNSPSGPQATNLGKTSQNNVENGHPTSTSTQEYVNLWSNIHNFEMQQHHDESTNINQQAQNNFWHKQNSNEETFQKHNFDAWHHETNRDKLIPQESGNNKETLLWDMIDKIIEETEKNESQVSNNEHTLNSYSIPNQGKTTEKNVIQTTQPFVNNENTLDKTNFISNIGRGDIGPEEIESLIKESNEKSDESLNLPKELRPVTNKINKEKENPNDKPIILNVIGIEDQKPSTTSTSKPKQQHRINDLNTQSFLEEYVPHSKPKNEHQVNYNHASTFDNIEQENLEQQYEHLEQTSMNDKFLLDFSQQSQVPINDNVETFSQSHYDQLEVQKHVPHEYQAVTQKLDNFGTRSKIISDKVEHPVEVTTEKPGFWKSVWGKTVNAKDTVVSWFKN